MTAADVFETVAVAVALLGALKLRYDDKAAIRKHGKKTTAEREHELAMAKIANGGEQS